MNEIRSRIIKRGDPCESSWPSDYGTRDTDPCYYDPETKTIQKGYPPQRNQKFGEAPYVISDSMEAYYHPAAEIWVDSKAKLRDVDNVCGTITSDKKLAPDPSKQRALNAARREDARESLHRAVAMVDAGTAPLTEEQRARCEQVNEITSKALNFDAFNVVGRKKDKRGKKFKSPKFLKG